jgi:hypothetical protein
VVDAKTGTTRPKLVGVPSNIPMEKITKGVEKFKPVMTRVGEHLEVTNVIHEEKKALEADGKQYESKGLFD